MRNSGFYDKDGNLITFDDLGVSVFDLLNMDLSVNIKDPTDIKQTLLDLILKNKNIRKNYLKEYMNKTNSYNEKTAIKGFIKYLETESEKVKKENETFARVQAFRDNLPETDPNYKVIKGLYKMLDDAYLNFLTGKVEIDAVYEYIEEISNLINLIKNKYNYNAKMDKNYQEWIEKISDIKTK